MFAKVAGIWTRLAVDGECVGIRHCGPINGMVTCVGAPGIVEVYVCVYICLYINIYIYLQLFIVQEYNEISDIAYIYVLYMKIMKYQVGIACIFMRIYVRAPSFRPTCFRPTCFHPIFFVQSYQVRLGQFRLGQVRIGRNGLDENRLDQNELYEKWVYHILCYSESAEPDIPRNP